MSPLRVPCTRPDHKKARPRKAVVRSVLRLQQCLERFPLGFKSACESQQPAISANMVTAKRNNSRINIKKNEHTSIRLSPARTDYRSSSSSEVEKDHHKTEEAGKHEKRSTLLYLQTYLEAVVY